ncbi:hypothetical protein B0O99DRAFT_620342 [Bisporella sp. PMI_857]|nr:hypothetical protein B0O99DRAFT_620342 [Bisporella sp. PMI_857]
MAPAHNIFLTGASGYLGGTLLARWYSANLPTYGKLFALVRTDEQASAVEEYGAEPLKLNLQDESAVHEALIRNAITIVFYLIDAVASETQVLLIKALAKVKKKTGTEVHFLHTTGAKIFSSHAGAPTDRELSDADPQLYDIQKSQKSPYPPMQQAVNTNCIIIEQAELHGVKSYIFTPCIVYGKGEGFGNKTSIQTVAIVKAAKALKRVYSTDAGRPSWPVCHVVDNTNLYLSLLRSILANENPGHGKEGYYLAASGSVVWKDLYAVIAKALAKRGIVESAEVEEASADVLGKMGVALGVPAEFVPVQLGGSCTFTAARGGVIGWKASYAPEHILKAADEEVELILNSLTG